VRGGHLPVGRHRQQDQVFPERVQDVHALTISLGI
jgi:hypothetical protein